MIAGLVHGKHFAFGIPFPVIVAAIVLIATAFLLNRLSIGRQIYGLGATLREQNAWAAISWASNALSMATRVYRRDRRIGAGAPGRRGIPNALIGRELDVLAAVVLGGASLQGGIGTVSGAILGIVLLAIVQNGLTLLGVSSYSFGFVTGLIILISVSATAIAAKRQQKRTIGNAA